MKNSQMQSMMSNNNLTVCASILIDNDEPRHLNSKRSPIHHFLPEKINRNSLGSAMKHSVQMLR